MVMLRFKKKVFGGYKSKIFVIMDIGLLDVKTELLNLVDIA